MGTMDQVKKALGLSGLVAEEDEFDPFRGVTEDAPPDGEGDDSIHGREPEG